MEHPLPEGVPDAIAARFLVRHDDVFLLSGPEVSASGLDLTSVTHEPGCHPLLMELAWNGLGEEERPSASVTFHAISAARRARGDVVDLSITLRRSAAATKNGHLILRLPFLPEAVEDPRFGTIAALSLKCGRIAAVEGLALGIAEGQDFLFAGHMPVRAVSHLSVASRIAARPQSPCLQLVAVIKPFEGEVTLRFARGFAGQDYAPYSFNPYYEKLAALAGPPDLGRQREARAEFLRAAEAAMAQHDYRGGQCFLKPCFVERGVDPRFPMLIGTPNSLSWYAQTTQHHGGFYLTDGYARSGETILDCGAHAGEIAMLFSKATGPAGRVIAFDPFPQNYLQVEAQAVLNDTPWLTSTRTGVGVRRDTVMTELEVQMTSGNKPINRAASAFPLAIEPLDDYLDARPSFLKLDVEGAEAGALVGAQRLLRECRPRIFIEVHPQFLPQFGQSAADLFAAIPRDIYHVQYNVPGAPPGWHDYGPEAPAQFEGKPGGLVRAFPR